MYMDMLISLGVEKYRCTAPVHGTRYSFAPPTSKPRHESSSVAGREAKDESSCHWPRFLRFADSDDRHPSDNAVRRATKTQRTIFRHRLDHYPRQTLGPQA